MLTIPTGDALGTVIEIGGQDCDAAEELAKEFSRMMLETELTDATAGLFALAVTAKIVLKYAHQLVLMRDPKVPMSSVYNLMLVFIEHQLGDELDEPDMRFQ